MIVGRMNLHTEEKDTKCPAKMLGIIVLDDEARTYPGLT